MQQRMVSGLILAGALAVAAACPAAAQTPSRDVRITTWNWFGPDLDNRNRVGDVVICLGNGRSGEEALFDIGTTDAGGNLRFFGSVPGGGTTRGTVHVHAAKACPPDVEPIGQLDGVDIYDCGVGGATFRPRQTPPGNLIEVEVRIGAASKDDALNAPATCGSPPGYVYPQAMQLRPSPLQLEVGKTGFVETRFTTARGTEQLYDFRWEIADRTIADVAPGTPTDVFEVEIVGKAQGTTTVTGYRQNFARPGHPPEEATDSATIVVAGGGPIRPQPGEPHTFGWETPVNQRAMTDFMLPRPCVVGINLAAIVHSPSPANGGCSIRANEDEGCSTCHRQGAQDPELELITKDAFCALVPEFATNATKPQNLKDFFNDWYDRRDPATGECPD